MELEIQTLSAVQKFITVFYSFVSKMNNCITLCKSDWRIDCVLAPSASRDGDCATLNAKKQIVNFAKTNYSWQACAYFISYGTEEF